MGRSSNMLKQVDRSKLPIPQAPSNFFNNSQAREIKDKHSDIVMYSNGPLCLGVKWNWQRVMIALLLVASWLRFCNVFNNNENTHYYDCIACCPR